MRKYVAKLSCHSAPQEAEHIHNSADKMPTTSNRKNNLIDLLIEARKSEFRSAANVAVMAGVSPNAIRRLEAGKGPVATLNAVMQALPLQVSGLAPGRTFAEQLRNRREALKLSVALLASKAALTPDQVKALESGVGTIQDLLAVLGQIAPNIQRRAPERAYWGVGDKTDRDSRFTPPSFMEHIYQAFGQVDLDPCGHRQSPVVAKRRFFLAERDNGLVDPWTGRFAFVNPPYSELLAWLRRAHEQWRNGNVKTVACLVPGRMDSAFFHDTVAIEADIFILQGRVAFLNLEGKSQATPFGLMLVVFGATAMQRERFERLAPGFWLSQRERNVAPARAPSTIEATSYRWSSQRNVYGLSCVARANESARAIRTAHVGPKNAGAG